MEAAARILETEGFDGYTTNAVAARAGVSVGSLYQYFPSKDAITRALIAREMGALLVDVLAIDVGEDEGPRVGLEQLIATAVAHQLRRPALARLLDLEEGRLPLGEDLGHVGERLAEHCGGLLARAGYGAAIREPWVVQDLLAIIKGMVDAAGAHGERDASGLVGRVSRAVFGYLDGSTEGRPLPSPMEP